MQWRYCGLYDYKDDEPVIGRWLSEKTAQRRYHDPTKDLTIVPQLTLQLVLFHTILVLLQQSILPLRRRFLHRQDSQPNQAKKSKLELHIKKFYGRIAKMDACSVFEQSSTSILQLT